METQNSALGTIISKNKLEKMKSTEDCATISVSSSIDTDKSRVVNLKDVAIKWIIDNIDTLNEMVNEYSERHNKPESNDNNDLGEKYCIRITHPKKFLTRYEDTIDDIIVICTLEEKEKLIDYLNTVEWWIESKSSYKILNNLRRLFYLRNEKINPYIETNNNGIYLLQYVKYMEKSSFILHTENDPSQHHVSNVFYFNEDYIPVLKMELSYLMVAIVNDLSLLEKWIYRKEIKLVKNLIMFFGDIL